MIGQALLTIPLLAMLVYGYVELRRAPMIGPAIPALAALNLVFVWVPGFADEVARVLGLGTRFDLISSVWVGLLLLVALNLHLRHRQQMHVITALARRIALRDDAIDGTSRSARGRGPHRSLRRQARASARASALRARLVTPPAQGERETGAPLGKRN